MIGRRERPGACDPHVMAVREPTDVRDQTQREAGPRPGSGRRAWKFIAWFGALFLLFQSLIFLLLQPLGLVHRHLVWSARVSSIGLRQIGLDVQAHDNQIVSHEYILVVLPGCDALQSSALLIAGVFAFRASLFQKLVGTLVGSALLVLLNLFRLTSLFLIGRSHPELFDTAHLEVWQALFILAAFVEWALWIRWVGSGSRTRSTSNALREAR